jgi:hypothetical protein
VGIFSFFFILAGVRALSICSILSILLLLWHADVSDEGLSVGIVHIAMG